MPTVRQLVNISAAQLAAGGGQQEIDYTLDRPPYTRYHWTGSAYMPDGPETRYTSAQLSALAAAGGLTQYASYVASDTGARYWASTAGALTVYDNVTFGEADPIDSDTYGSGLTGHFAAPAFVRSIGTSDAVAAAMESFSAAMPKDGRWNSPQVAEQGVIELAAGAYTLERTLEINLASASTSRHGLTIRGQGSVSTIFNIASTAAPANFKGGDNIWRGFHVIGSDGTKVRNLRVQGLGIINYATQGGDGSTRLSDALSLWDFEYCLNGMFEDLFGYNRSLTALSRDQTAFRFQQCYYFSARDLQAQNFPHTNSGQIMSGAATGARQCGVGFTFELNNAGTCSNLVVGQADLALYLLDEHGLHISGGSVEGVNKGMLLDGTTSGCVVVGVRPEFHMLDSTYACEAPTEMWSVLATETTSNNDVEWHALGVSPRQKSFRDLSADQSNLLRGPRDQRLKKATNLLGAWSLSAGVTASTNADLPPGAEGSATSVELTYNGTINVDRYQVVSNINPDCGSLTYRAWMKRVSGDGMIAHYLYAATGNVIYPFSFVDPTPRWSGNLTIPLASSGHSWAANELTLVCSRAHYCQAGMRLQANGNMGSGGGMVPDNTYLYIKSVTNATTLVFTWTAGDPGSISSPSPLDVPSDMVYWLGQEDVTADWVEVVGTLPIRYSIIGIALDGSDHPICTFSSSAYVPPSGSTIRLSGFADSRLNGALHTVGGGDISGAALTISSLTTAGLDVTTAAITGEDSTIDHYGYIGHTAVRVSQRCKTSAGTTMVWRVAGERLLAGSANVMAAA